MASERAASPVDWLADVVWAPAVISLIVWAGVLMGVGDPRGDWPFDPHAQWTSYDHRESGTVSYFGMLFGMLFAALVIVVAVEFKRLGDASTPARVVAVLNVCLGQIESLALTVAATELGKVLVGELRPDYRDRCLGDTYDPTATYGDSVPCVATDEDEWESGRQSFPSGHSSSAMCIGLYVSLYLYWCLYFREGASWAGPGRSRLHDNAVHLLGLVAMGPTVVAIIVGYSRIVHWRHHPWDVMAGFFLGVLFAAAAFVRMVVIVARAGTASAGGAGAAVAAPAVRADPKASDAAL